MPREALIADLRRLSSRELRLTVAELEPRDREQVLALVREGVAGGAAPSFQSLVGLSPWLLKALDKNSAGAAGAGPLMTPATVAALSEALERLASTQAPNLPTGRKTRFELARLFGAVPLPGRAA